MPDNASTVVAGTTVFGAISNNYCLGAAQQIGCGACVKADEKAAGGDFTGRGQLINRMKWYI